MTGLDRLAAALSEALRLPVSTHLTDQALPFLPPAVSPEPGPVSLDRTPYLREPLDALSPDDPCEMVVLQGATQMGKSTLALLAWSGWVQLAPGPCLWVTDTDQKAEELAKYRVEPAIAASDALRSLVPLPRAREKGNTTQAKAYPGGYTRWSGAQTISGLTSITARYVILDELDDHAAVLGDTVRLALGRTTTYGRARKILAVSSPTITGRSPIETWRLRGDDRRYLVPCPHCGEYQPLEWRDVNGRHRLILPEDGGPAAYLCRACERLIDESAKAAMLAAGRWAPTQEPRDPSIRSYLLPALYAPPGWLSWQQLAVEWREAQARVAANDTQELRVFVNTRLAESWEDRGIRVDPLGLSQRAEPLDAPYPEQIRYVTLGVDVQEDRLEVTALGIGAGWELWILDHRQILGDPLADGTWGALDALRARPWPLTDGRTLQASLTAVDAGYLTSRVIEYARRRRDVEAVRGVSGKRPVWDPKRRKHAESIAKRWHAVGVDAAKDYLAQAWRVTVPGPRYIHIAARILTDYPDWPEQVCSEERREVRQSGRVVSRWVARRGVRQEALDCLVYALAAAHAVMAGRPTLAEPTPAAPPRQRPAAPRPTARPAASYYWDSHRGRD